MTVVESIALDKLTIIDSWRKASPGSILQVTAATKTGDVPVIGMCCHEERNGFYLLVLDGEHVGKLFSGAELLGPALEITDLVELRVTDPTPAPLNPKHREIGGLVCGSARSGRLYVGCHMGEQRVSVCLHDRTASNLKGKIVSKVVDDDVFAIGRTEIIPREPA